MNLIDYIIEDAEIVVDGKALWANGKVEVAYTYEAAQPSVGYHGGIEISHFGEMTVDLSDENWDTAVKTICAPGSTLFDTIIKSLGEERIVRAIADAHETF